MPKIDDHIMLTPSQPRQLRLDTIAGCNAKCLSCHRFLTERAGTMPRELFLQVLNDVARWERPLEELVPTNYGEFFLLKDWSWFLSRICEKLPRTKVVIPTNGSMLDEIAVRQLCAFPNVKVVNFSVNAYYDETYERFMGLPASNIERIKKAVKYIDVLRPDIIKWASMVFDLEYQTDYERDTFINYWIPHAAPQILAAQSAGRPGKKPQVPVTLPCRSIFSDFVIGFDGKLSSCCFDSGFTLDIGSYTGDVKKDWKNEKIEALRKAHNEHLRSTITLCKECTFA